MKFKEMIPATFIKRKNRFVAQLSLSNGDMVEAHLANTGRMRELLITGRKVLLSFENNPERTTQYNLWFIENGEGEWICLRAVFANALVEEWLSKGMLNGFEKIENLQRECQVLNSRFDFKFRLKNEWWIAEVKSVNYVMDKVGLFPDAPTKRGKKHLEELIQLKKQGYNTAVFFVTMGAKVDRLCINSENDPEFAEAFLKAKSEGIEVRAWESNFTRESEFYFEKEITTIEV